MNIIFQFTMAFGAIGAYMGGAAYFFEVTGNRVSMSTKWSDLDTYQLIAAFLAIGGILLFITSLILGALTKGM
jgi:hypothetical protein